MMDRTVRMTKCEYLYTVVHAPNLPKPPELLVA